MSLRRDAHLWGWSAGIAALVFLVDLVFVFGDPLGLAQSGFMLEDGFYYLSLAKNFYQGNGFSLDGIHSTSGFQPLHLFLLSAFAWIKDPWSLMRMDLALNAAYHAGAAAALYVLLERVVAKPAAACLALLWALAASTRHLLLNGMETGLFLGLALATVAVWHRRRDLSDPKALFPAGLILGLCYLARVDAVFVALVLIAAELFRRRADRLERAAWLAVPALALAIPWMAVSWAYGGHILPESGQASRRLALDLNDGSLNYDLMGPLARTGSLSDKLWLDRGVRYVATTALETVAWSSPLSASFGWAPPVFLKKPGSYWLSRAVFARPWLAGLVLGLFLVLAFAGWQAYGLGVVPLIAVGIWFFYAFLPAPAWYFIRYLILLVLVWSVGIGLACLRWLPRRPWMRIAGVLVTAAICFVFVRQGHALYPRPQEPFGYVREAFWIRDHLPKDAVVASFQNGVLSYFSERLTLNLDGVANAQALAAVKERRLPSYLAASNATHLADFSNLLERYVPLALLQAHGVNLVHLKTGFFNVYRLEKMGDESVRKD